MMIETLLLDVDNTLLDFHAGAKECIRNGFALWGLPFNENTFPTFTRLNNGLWRQIETGERTREELYRDRWNIIFEALGIEADGQAFETLFRTALSQSAVPVEGAMEILAYLADKYRLCVASNGPWEQQTGRLRRAGMLDFFDQVFVSERIGAQKPTAEFFDACMESLDQPDKESVMIIGDSLTADIGGGVEYGLKTCWYNHDKIPHPDDLAADYAVECLPDLRHIL